MTTLNGRKMKVDDVVHDVIKGAGKVINDGGGTLNVVVDFGESGTMSFAQDGTFQGKQRLYWKPPYIFQPRGPDDESYEKTIELSQMIYEFFKSYEKRQKNS